MSEVTFTRSNDYQDTHLSRAQAPGWAIEVWRDKRKQPISFYRHADNYSMTTALDLDSATARALARWYSARGNVKAARRKAVQLLAALAVLEGVLHV